MLMEADCFRYGDKNNGSVVVRLRLSVDNVVSRLMEANSFRYDKFLFLFLLFWFYCGPLW